MPITYHITHYKDLSDIDQFDSYKEYMNQVISMIMGIPEIFFLNELDSIQWYKKQTEWLIQTEQITLKDL